MPATFLLFLDFLVFVFFLVLPWCPSVTLCLSTFPISPWLSQSLSLCLSLSPSLFSLSYPLSICISSVASVWCLVSGWPLHCEHPPSSGTFSECQHWLALHSPSSRSHLWIQNGLYETYRQALTFQNKCICANKMKKRWRKNKRKNRKPSKQKIWNILEHMEMPHPKILIFALIQMEFI